jgi:hypothetical protein
MACLSFNCIFIHVLVVWQIIIAYVPKHIGLGLKHIMVTLYENHINNNNNFLQ